MKILNLYAGICGKKRLTTRGHNETIEIKQKIKGFDLNNFKDIDKNKILRNCVEPTSALHIFNMGFKIKQTKLNGDEYNGNKRD